MRTRLMMATVLGLTSFATAGDTELTIGVPETGVVLAGTLSVPDEGEGPFPGIILLTGSGPQDRDETILGQKPFRVLADVFVERGFAVLRCDDRGVGASTGTFQGATLDDFVDDASAQIKAIGRDERVDGKRVFVLGHSEGGSVAAELGAAGAVSGGVVFLGATAIPGHEVLTDQSIRLMRAMGVDEDRLEKIRVAHEALMQTLLDGGDDEEVLEKTVALIIEQSGGGLPEDFAKMQAGQFVEQFKGAWFEQMIRHDPSEATARLTVPGLALYGSLDQQVSDEANAGPMADALTHGRHSLSRVIVLPGKNHLFQNARTGAFEEYGALDDLDPDVGHEIADWIGRVIDNDGARHPS